MVKEKICPICGSDNCEESIKKVTKRTRTIHLYPLGTKKVICYLCYDCGASETIYANN